MRPLPSVPAAVAPSSAALAELRRILPPGGVARGMLRQRLVLMCGLGVALGLLHLLARGPAGPHPAVTAFLAAFVPVFAPVCFVPVTCGGTAGSPAGPGVWAVRLGVPTLLGWVVAAAHLGVWAALAAISGSLAAPTAGDVPFTLAAVAVTALVVGLAYRAGGDGRQRRSEARQAASGAPQRRSEARQAASGAPQRRSEARQAASGAPQRRSDARARRVAVAAVCALYALAFWVHAQLLPPRLVALRGLAAAHAWPFDLACVAVALLAVWVLMRREVGAAGHEAGLAQGRPARP